MYEREEIREMKMRAVQSLSGVNGIFISKDRVYEIVRKDIWSFKTIDNFGNEINLSPEEVEYKFVESE